MIAGRWTSLAGVGLFTSVVAWALHQQAGVMMASWACENAAQGIWLGALLGGILLAAGAILSGLALRAARSSKLIEDAARPRRFIAKVSLMASALFLFAIGLQAAAPLFLPGCVG
jgi:hypothetical protein